MKIAADAGLVLDDFYKPKADIVIDANTGAILYGDNIDTVRDSGSMAKLMSAYVVFRALKEGEDQVRYRGHSNRGRPSHLGKQSVK